MFHEHKVSMLACRTTAVPTNGDGMEVFLYRYAVLHNCVYAIGCCKSFFWSWSRRKRKYVKDYRDSQGRNSVQQG